MNDPEWFAPGNVVRLAPTLALPDWPQTAVLQPVTGGNYLDWLAYPREDGGILLVRPEHVEPVEAPARKVSFREFL